MCRTPVWGMSAAPKDAMVQELVDAACFCRPPHLPCAIPTFPFPLHTAEALTPASLGQRCALQSLLDATYPPSRRHVTLTAAILVTFGGVPAPLSSSTSPAALTTP